MWLLNKNIQNFYQCMNVGTSRKAEPVPWGYEKCNLHIVSGKKEFWNKSAKSDTMLINVLQDNKTLIFGIIFSTGQGKKISLLSLVQFIL